MAAPERRNGYGNQYIEIGAPGRAFVRLDHNDSGFALCKFVNHFASLQSGGTPRQAYKPNGIGEKAESQLPVEGAHNFSRVA